MELLSELKTLITNSTKESIQQAKDIASENQLRCRGFAIRDYTIGSKQIKYYSSLL